MFDLIAIGNISIDLFYKGHTLTVNDGRFQLAIGGKYFTDFFFEGIGGGGTNVAIGTKKLGLNSAIFGKVGTGDYGQMVVNKLQNIGVNTSLLQKVDGYYNISSILVNEKGEQTIINYDTAGQHLINNPEDLQKLLNTKIIYFGNLPNVDWQERVRMINHVSNKDILIITNIGVNDCRRDNHELEEYLKNTNILIVNAHEFSDIAKRKYEEIDFRNNVLALAAYLNDKVVIVTDGGKGSYGYYQGNCYYQEAVKIDKIIQSAGCGDAYTSGFITEYSKSKDIVSSMSKGANYASRILTQLGAN